MIILRTFMLNLGFFNALIRDLERLYELLPKMENLYVIHVCVHKIEAYAFFYHMLFFLFLCIKYM